VYMRMCVGGCVVVLDWCLACTFGVSGAGVLMRALCLMGGVCGAGVTVCYWGSVWCRCYCVLLEGVCGTGVTGWYWRECAGDGQVGIGVEI
jgi:hypothetical protein